MTPRTVRKLRDRVAQSISYETARAAGLTFEQLRGFVSGYYWLDEGTLAALAAHMKMKTEELT